MGSAGDSFEVRDLMEGIPGWVSPPLEVGFKKKHGSGSLFHGSRPTSPWPHLLRGNLPWQKVVAKDFATGAQRLRGERGVCIGTLPQACVGMCQNSRKRKGPPRIHPQKRGPRHARYKGLSTHTRQPIPVITTSTRRVQDPHQVN